MSFHDHFSGYAAAYARSRPTYPPELYRWLASLTPGRACAWDCGTGNGQAAVGLAEHFDAVLATDASAAQLQEAAAHPRVRYLVAREDASGLPAQSVDLVTVAQAFHWFDAAAFFGEARRVLRSSGVVALWCYNLHRAGPDVDPLLDRFYREVVGQDWPPERALLEREYKDVEFPFEEIQAPPFVMERSWDLPTLGAYIDTWSAVQRHRKRTGRDPLPPLMQELAAHWGDPARPRRVVWPLALRVGRPTR